MDNSEVTFTRKKKKTAGANDRLRNILNLLYMLLMQDNGSLDYYAGKLNCKASTVKKYIEDIRSTYDPVNNTSFSIEYNKSTQHYELFNDLTYISFSQEEIEKLHMAASYLAIQKGTPFEEINKLEEKLKKFSLVKEEDLLHKSVLISAPEVRSELKKWLKTIDNAIYSRKKLEINYIKTESTEEEIREIVPYSLLIYDYEWYVRAFCLKDKKFKTYAINQFANAVIKKLTSEEEKELPEEGEKEAEHKWDWLGKEEPVSVKLKFKGKIAEAKRKKYKYRKEHPSQILEEFNDTLIVSYKVKNPRNMVEWVMQFGSSVEVLEPEVLKEKIRGEIEKMKAIY